MTETLSSRPVQYVVISPVRNEAQHLERTIESVVQQTVRPFRWLLVNDGSTDETSAIIERYASQYPWIVPVHRSGMDRSCAATGVKESKANRGKRALEAKEIEAFYAGYDKLTASDWEFLVKARRGLEFRRRIISRSALPSSSADPKLGIGGGMICHLVNGQLDVEPTPQFHVRGATKIYRRTCWEQIGGVSRGAGWDTLDEDQGQHAGMEHADLPGV